MKKHQKSEPTAIISVHRLTFILFLILFLINSVRHKGCNAHFVIFLHRFLVVDRPAGECNTGVLKLFNFIFIVDFFMSVKAYADCRVVKAFLKVCSKARNFKIEGLTDE